MPLKIHIIRPYAMENDLLIGLEKRGHWIKGQKTLSFFRHHGQCIDNGSKPKPELDDHVNKLADIPEKDIHTTEHHP